MSIKDLAYRGWYYFRNGWSVYFAFILAAINTLTVTYYLAVEKIPPLKEIFPSFLYYVVFFVIIGIPILVIVGYVHWKRSGARRAEIDIAYEVNPYRARILVNSEMVLKINIKLMQTLIKLLTNVKLTEQESKEIKKLQNEIEEFVNKRTFTNKLDLKYIKTETQEIQSKKS